MNSCLWILLAALLLCGLYLWLIAPARKRPDASMLSGWLYAHRGLHDGNQRVPENSLEAFRLALANGYGMELDVQHTKDDQLVVFHDASLKRVCKVDLNIRDLTYEQLKQHPLPDGTPVPLFSEVLALVNGKAPLIVEIKHYGKVIHNAEATLRALRAYHGPYCVESFHPAAVRYFKKNAPDIVRGQLASGGKRGSNDVNAVEYFAMKQLLVNVLGRPHFVAYSVPTDHTLAMWLMKRLYKPLLAAWTVRSQALLDSTTKNYDYPIFELFTPKR
ncbi:MAG: glycerophosphodiester phosphodiesterase family protein [Clostridia bacterium]